MPTSRWHGIQPKRAAKCQNGESLRPPTWSWKSKISAVFSTQQ